MSEYHSVYTTWPDDASARSAARALVSEGLSACANIFPAVTSVYEWEGEIVEDAECVMILKVAGTDLAPLRARISALHSYTVPCIVTLPIEQAHSNPDYLAWLDDHSRREV